MTHTKTTLHIKSALVLSTGLLLQAHSVLAGDAMGDAQAQARALLDRPVPHHVTNTDGTSTQTSREQTHADRGAYRDPQALARALLLGQSNEGGAARTAVVGNSKESGRWPHADPQEAARRMILGSEAPVVAAPTIVISER